jgi:Protein of unknown function (DUF3040)
VSGLSLNAHDRHALAQIEEALADADPKFAAKLSSFARLADAGSMPERERIGEARRPVFGSSICGMRPGQPGAHKLIYLIIVATAVALTVAMISFALVSHPSGKGGCAGWQTAACAKQATTTAPAHSGQQGYLPSLVP